MNTVIDWSVSGVCIEYNRCMAVDVKKPSNTIRLILPLYREQCSARTLKFLQTIYKNRKRYSVSAWNRTFTIIRLLECIDQYLHFSIFVEDESVENAQPYVYYSVDHHVLP